MARRSKTADFGDVYNNPFAGRQPAPIAVGSRRVGRGKRNTPIWIWVLVLFCVLGAGGYGVYYVTHAPVTGSAKAVTEDFLRQFAAMNVPNVLKDVQPSERATARNDLAQPFVQRVRPNIPTTDYFNGANVTSNGTSAQVNVNLCGANFSCSYIGNIPVVEVNGSWYVAWDAYLEAAGLTP